MADRPSHTPADVADHPRDVQVTPLTPINLLAGPRNAPVGMPPQHLTDISDKSWTDLVDADRDVLQELGKERDGIDGRWGDEALAAALLAYHGRVDEIPDEAAEEHVDEIETALAAGEGADEPDAEDEPDEDEYGTQVSSSATETKPEGEAPTEDDREVEPEEADTGRDKKLGSSEEPVREDSAFIIDAGILDSWLDYAGALVEECKVHLTADGLRITAVDPANVAMVDTDLRAAAFESFDVGDLGLIGVNLDRLTDVVGRADADALVHVEVDAQRRNLVVSWDGHEFTLSLIDPDSIRKEPDVPDLDLPVTVEWERAGVLHDAITFADDVSDHVRFDAGDAVFEVYAEGDTDSYHGEFEDGGDLTFGARGYASSLFSMDYLKDIRSAWDKDEPLRLTIGDEFPCDIRQDVVTDDHTVGEATFLIAPRIQSD